MVDQAFTTMLVIGAICFLMAATLTVTDVVLRGLFSKSVPAGVELTALLVGLGAILSIPNCFATNTHVTAKLLSEFFPRVLGRPLFWVGSVGSIVFAWAAFFVVAQNTYEKLASAETTPDAGLPVNVLLGVVSAGFLIAAIGALLGASQSPGKGAEHG